MKTLTLKSHKVFVRLLSKQLGRVRKAEYPTADVVGNYLRSAYLFKCWIVYMDGRGCIYVLPTANHPAYDMYVAYNCSSRHVCVWLDMGAWDDWAVARSPEQAAIDVLKFISKVDGI